MSDGTLIVTDLAGTPKLSLLAVTPQPANPEVTISFAVVESGSVAINLYNLLGQRVLQQSVNAAVAGEYHQTLLVGSLASGTYILSLEAGGTMVQQPLTLLK